MSEKAITLDRNNNYRILRLPDVKSRTGLSRSSIYLKLASGSFPRPVSLGARSIGFVESEIDDWIAERIRVSREKTGQVRP